MAREEEKEKSRVTYPFENGLNPCQQFSEIVWERANLWEN